MKLQLIYRLRGGETVVETHSLTNFCYNRVAELERTGARFCFAFVIDAATGVPVTVYH